MPVIFRCKKCGAVIYVFKRVGQDCFGLPTPTELSLKLGGRCPKCGRIIGAPTLNDVRIEGRVKSLPIYVEPVEISPPASQGGVLSTASVSQ